MTHCIIDSCLRPYPLVYSLKTLVKNGFLAGWMLFCVGFLLGMHPAHAQTTGQNQPGKRIALLIGNATYKGNPNTDTLDWERLKNAAKDAQDVGNELKKLGFRSDDVEVLQNISRRDMILALERFKERVRKADQVVFYYSGHGLQDESLNYLIPVDAPDRRRINLIADTVTLKEVIGFVSVGTGQKVVMIDACRTAPGSKGDGGGLANPEKERPLPPGVTVVFAAAANQRAMDGFGYANGFFAQGLLEGLRQNDTSLRNVLDVAEAKVFELSGGMQEVTPYGGALRQKRFAFAPSKPFSAIAPVVDPRLAESQARIAELEKRLQAVPPIAAQTPIPAPVQPLRGLPPAAQQPIPSPTVQAATASSNGRGVGAETPAYPGGPIMVTLPQGSYIRGSEDEVGRNGDEGPTRVVTIAYTLQMGKTEVTRGQFAEFVRATRYAPDRSRTSARCDDGVFRSSSTTRWNFEPVPTWHNPGFEQTDSHPVVCVSWNDAQKYTDWVNEKAGIPNNSPNRFRLPSESEFEFAARGVTSPTQQLSGKQHTRFYWGDDPDYEKICSHANTAYVANPKKTGLFSSGGCDDGYINTAPVSSYGNTAATRHPFGLFDMAGNVQEWAQDCGGNYSQVPSNGTANESFASGQTCYRVRRGGSWRHDPSDSRSADRGAWYSEKINNFTGLRLARTLP
jgi:formylglycine-generating enzyme required for sulfatase activity